MDTSSQGNRQVEEGGLLGLFGLGSPEAANRYKARRAAASAGAEAKTLVWEELEKDF